MGADGDLIKSWQASWDDLHIAKFGSYLMDSSALEKQTLRNGLVDVRQNRILLMECWTRLSCNRLALIGPAVMQMKALSLSSNSCNVSWSYRHRCHDHINMVLIIAKIQDYVAFLRLSCHQRTSGPKSWKRTIKYIIRYHWYARNMLGQIDCNVLIWDTPELSRKPIISLPPSFVYY